MATPCTRRCFSRAKQGQKPGFPRFKSARRYDSITFPSHGDGNILESRLHVTDRNLAAIFWTPDDVILEAEYGPGILAVPAATM
jgi:hypothetical protein